MTLSRVKVLLTAAKMVVVENAVVRPGHFTGHFAIEAAFPFWLVVQQETTTCSHRIDSPCRIVAPRSMTANLRTVSSS
jgi:hypothetical protein